MNNMTLAYVGLGSNLEDPEAQIDKAIRTIVSSDDFSMVVSSSYYKTSPVGYDEQDDFINAVVRFDTSLRLGELYQFLRRIERKQGRRRDPNEKNGPRTIDCDILLYGSHVVNHEKLIVPHPRMTERLFVLKPLLELDRNVQIPGKGKASELLQALEQSEVGQQQRIVKL